jgi:hypothetical protein
MKKQLKELRLTYESGVHKCRKCGKILPIEQFNFRKKGHIQSWCKSCTNERNNERNKIKRVEDVTKDKPYRTRLTDEEDPSIHHARIMHAKGVVRENVERARTKRILKEFNEYNKLHPDE